MVPSNYFPNARPNGPSLLRESVNVSADSCFERECAKPGLRGRDSKEVPVLGNRMMWLGGGAVFFYFAGSEHKIRKDGPAALPYVISKYLFTRFRFYLFIRS